MTTSDPLVWIDCEMTGLDLSADALIEVAVVVTDYELRYYRAVLFPAGEGPTSEECRAAAEEIAAHPTGALLPGTGRSDPQAGPDEDAGRRPIPPRAGAGGRPGPGAGAGPSGA